MTVAELRELLAECDPDNTVELHYVKATRDRYVMVEGLSSCEIQGVTFLDGGTQP